MYAGMYVCMHVCMFACMYACVCIYVRMNVFIWPLVHFLFDLFIYTGYSLITHSFTDISNMHLVNALFIRM